MVSQVTGLAQAVGWSFEHRPTVLRRPFRWMWPGLIPPTRGVFADPAVLDVTAAPRVIVSCGRQAVVASIALKRKLGDRVFTVHIQDPRVSTKHFDLIVTPQHDGLTGSNVVHSLGAVHHISSQRLADAARSGPTAEMAAALRGPFVGVVVGGPNRYYGYTSADLDRLVADLKRLVQREPVQLAIVPSRRTPPAAIDRLAAEFGSRHFVWRGRGENPYLAVLALASHLVVTCDSVSMISEAAATTRPLYVAQLQERRRARRFRKFHQSFENAGITRVFDGRLESWTYASPDRTPLIASLIFEHLR
jgi:mitochondrial fission protein ELM1